MPQGTSLNVWCKGQGMARQNADKALFGQWKGPSASEPVKRILAASGAAE